MKWNSRLASNWMKWKVMRRLILRSQKCLGWTTLNDGPNQKYACCSHQAAGRTAFLQIPWSHEVQTAFCLPGQRAFAVYFIPSLCKCDKTQMQQPGHNEFWWDKHPGWVMCCHLWACWYPPCEGEPSSWVGVVQAFWVMHRDARWGMLRRLVRGRVHRVQLTDTAMMASHRHLPLQAISGGKSACTSENLSVEQA